MRGSTYTIQFEIDQRKCDIFLLITNILNVYNNQKGFKIVDMKSYANPEGVVTTYIDFEENDPKFKSNV